MNNMMSEIKIERVTDKIRKMRILTQDHMFKVLLAIDTLSDEEIDPSWRQFVFGDYVMLDIYATRPLRLWEIYHYFRLNYVGTTPNVIVLAREHVVIDVYSYDIRGRFDDRVHYSEDRPTFFNAVRHVVVVGTTTEEGECNENRE